MSEASVRHDVATETRTLARLVAEVDGRVVGVSRLRDHGERSMVMVQVLPSYRRRGVGSALLDAVLPYAVAAGATSVGSIVNGDEGSQAAATAWGFTHERRHTMSAVDPRTVVGPDPGADVVPLSECDPRAVHDCFVACAADDPSGLSQAYSFEEFLRDDWSHPLHAAALGRAVVADGTVLAFAQVSVAGDRAWNDFTGTRPSARGAKLALRVKAASLVALAEAGVTTCGTGNDAANAPMLAVNTRLGYRPTAWTSGATRSLA